MRGIGRVLVLWAMLLGSLAAHAEVLQGGLELRWGDPHSPAKGAALAPQFSAVLVLDGLEVHVPKPYIYAAMGFSVMVEWLNLLMRRNAKQHHIPGSDNW